MRHLSFFFSYFSSLFLLLFIHFLIIYRFWYSLFSFRFLSPLLFVHLLHLSSYSIVLLYGLAYYVLALYLLSLSSLCLLPSFLILHIQIYQNNASFSDRLFLSRLLPNSHVHLQQMFFVLIDVLLFLVLPLPILLVEVGHKFSQ